MLSIRFRGLRLENHSFAFALEGTPKSNFSLGQDFAIFRHHLKRTGMGWVSE